MDSHPRIDDALPAGMEGIRALVRSLIADEHAVDDVLQDAHLVALRKGIAPMDAPATWWRGVVRHLAWRLRRGRARRESRERMAARQEAVATGSPRLDTLELVAEVVAVMRGLPEPYRSTLVRRYLEDRTPASIAREQDVSVETVKTRIRRGLRQLRARLDASQGGGERHQSSILGLPLLAFPRRAAGTALAAAVLPILVTVMKMKVALVVVAALLVAWWALPGTEAPAVSAPAGGSGPVLEASTAEDPPAAIGSEPIATAPYRAAVAATPRENPEGEILEVVEAATGRPLPGATVHFWDADTPKTAAMQEAFDPFETPDMERRIIASGQYRVADGRGMVTLPPFARTMVVSGRLGGLWGRAHIDRKAPQPFRLELQIDLTLRVVVDAAGELRADVPVVITAHVGDWSSDWGRGVTGADGSYTFRHLQEWGRGAKYRLVVGLAYYFPGSARVDIDLDALPKEPVRLTLPPTGRLIIDVVDDDGQPIDGETLVGLATIAPRPFDEGPVPHQQQWKRIHEGRAAFPHVGLNLAPVAWVCVTDGTREPARHALKGPTKPGEEVRFTVTAGQRYRVLRGRAVTENGEALDGRKIAISFARRGNPVFDVSSQEVVETGEGGAFTVRFPKVPLKLALCDLRFRTPAWPSTSRAPNAKPVLVAAVPAPAALRERHDTDIGEVVFRPPPMVAGGQVVDDRGMPMEGVTVQVAIATHQGSETVWLPANTLRVDTLEDGTFDIRGPLPLEQRLRLQPTKDGYVPPPPTPVTPGASDLRLILPRPAFVEGRILLPAQLKPSSVQVEFVSSPAPEPDPQAESPRWRATAIDPDGSFRAVVLPGSAALRVSISRVGSFLSEPEVLHHVDGLRVAAGGTCRDPRVQAIDLRGILRDVVLTVVDQEGRPVPLADVRVRGEGLPRHAFNTQQTGVDGTCQVVLGPAVVEVTIAKTGYATESLGHLQEDREDRQVVLRPGIPIETTVSGITVAPPGTTFTISCRRELEQHPEPAWWPEDSAPLTPGAPTTLRVSEPGVFEVVLIVGDGWGPQLVTDRIEIRDVGRPASLLLHVPPGHLEEALRKRPK
jgi:RNA polymerase sigma factor (sigma-70 family)